MASKWQKFTVMELQARGCLLVEDGNHGENRPRPDEFCDSGVSFIRAADMDGGSVLFRTASRINDHARSRIRKGIGKPGDVLLSHKGTVGKVAYTSLECEPFVCSPQTTFWRVTDSTCIDRIFLYYYLCSKHFQNQLNAHKDESDMAGYVSLTAQRTLEVLLPPIEVQRKLGLLLRGFDDKIELDRRNNETLKTIARVIFKSWFIDFDPVREKAEGKKPFGMDDETAALFPSNFEDSELGAVPKGWSINTIGEMANVVGGSTPSTKEPAYWCGEYHFVTPKDMSNLKAPFILGSERRITKEGLECISSGLLPVGTLLLSSRAPIGYLAIADVPVSINQGIIAMIPNGNLPSSFLLFWTESNIDTILNNANGTTFQEISKSNFRPIKMVVPSREVVERFEAIVAPLNALIVNNLKEISTLTTLRDTLLLKLLSREAHLKASSLEAEA